MISTALQPLELVGQRQQVSRYRSKTFRGDVRLRHTALDAAGPLRTATVPLAKVEVVSSNLISRSILR
jgi:hypothetical protein